MKKGTQLMILWGNSEETGKPMYGTYIFTGIWFPVGDEYFIQFERMKDKTLTNPLPVADLAGKCHFIGKVSKKDLPKDIADTLQA